MLLIGYLSNDLPLLNLLRSLSHALPVDVSTDLKVYNSIFIIIYVVSCCSGYTYGPTVSLEIQHSRYADMFTSTSVTDMISGVKKTSMIRSSVKFDHQSDKYGFTAAACLKREEFVEFLCWSSNKNI